MKNIFPTAICFFVLFSCSVPLAANSELRAWNMENGDSITAEIVAVDEKNQKLTIREQKGLEKTVLFSELGKLDKAWVLEWIEMNEEMAEKVAELGGKLERFDGQGEKFKTGFYVYHPSGEVSPDTKRPVMIIIDPSGNPVRYLLRHIEAAEQTKITLISCEYFRNRRDFPESFSRFGDLYPVIRSSVPHDKLYLGGTSGGAWYVFAIAAEFPELKVAGVYSNGGWLGPSPQNLRPYPACRVAMVNGDKDHPVAGEVDSVTKILQDRGCTVSLYAFEGGHQIPPPSVQAKSFRWLLGE